MIAEWMLYGTVVGLLLAAAAHAAEQLVAARGWPRRWVWLAAMVVLPLVPFLPSVTPKTSVTAAVPMPPVVVAPGAKSQRRLVDAARLHRPLAMAWAAGTALLLLGYAAAAATLAWRRRRWHAAEVDGYAVLIARDAGPAVVGVLAPRIVLPAWALALDRPRRALILAHEREHLRAGDPLLLQLVMLAAFLVPWNLAVWWMLRRLRLAIEVDCDARVLRAGGDAGRYTELLLAVGATRTSARPLLAPALVEGKSSLSQGITAMFPTRSKFPRLRLACSAVAVCTLIAGAYVTPAPVFAQDPQQPGKRIQLHGTMELEIHRDSSGRSDSTGTGVDTIRTGDTGTMIIVVDSIVRSDSTARVEPSNQPSQLRLRGSASVLHANDPLVILNGTRIQERSQGASPLDKIDPNSIERVEVLNGPSAATLYGADAANGVIVITTKSGEI